ncbi:SAM-dependent methyltransferase [Altererythrobacter fulvus]|uniref:SAM-dependent methyltransferase n=1 Tax=Caenibius fulvus TaxID=2126012 RepID=UPI003018040C
MIGLLFKRSLREEGVQIDSRREPDLFSPVSQACTQRQMAEPAYAYWCAQIAEEPRTHRKQWEFCYILQVLCRHGMLAPGLKGLGFGVGGEPLASVFAARGVSVLATDLEPQRALESGWVDTAQHAASKAELNARALCAPEPFERLVDFRFMDMNAIDGDLKEAFDFCWSACALEHLGSIEQGLDFIANSVDCLRPGGLAVHTTEFNCSSNRDTLDHASTVLFRRKDFLHLADRLAKQGCALDFNFNLGKQPLDHHVDLPPYSVDNHLKLQIGRWTTTSFGIVVRKAGQAEAPR